MDLEYKFLQQAITAVVPDLHAVINRVASLLMVQHNEGYREGYLDGDRLKKAEEVLYGVDPQS